MSAIPRTERIVVAAIVLASFALFSTYSLATPLFEASDELWHYPMVQTLAAGNGLPVQGKDHSDAVAPWRQEGSQPPLYYAIAALASAPFDSSNWRELRRLNPHADMGVPTRDGNANAVLRTQADEFPWQRAALAVRVARLVSIVMSVFTVLFAYLVARELFAKFALLRIASTVFVACTPMFAFISGAINNDNAAVLFSTMGLWWALRLLRTRALSARSAIVAGVITAGGALCKVSALGMLGLFCVMAVLVVFVSGDGIRARMAKLFRFGLVLAAITALLAGWWYVRNIQLYGDWLGWNAFLDAVGRREPPATLAQLWTEREGFAWAYWGVFGTLNVIYPPIVYDALNGMALLAVVGCGVGLMRYRVRERLVLSQIALCAFWVALIFIALIRWTTLTPASQGRLMFPVIAVLSAAMAYGLWRLHRMLLMAGVLAFTALSIVTPFFVIAPVYARPPSAWAAPLPRAISVTFADLIQLAEASDTNAPILAGDEATLHLNWQLLRAAPKNYSVFVHLVDEHGVIVAQRDMHPGQGTLALAEMHVPYRWSDRYTLRLSPLALAPKQLRWRVGVYDAQTGERLRAADGREFAEFGALVLKRRIAEALLDYANGLRLSDYDVQPRALSPGQSVTITLHLRAIRPLDGAYNVSLQLLDDNARKAAQQDFAFADGDMHTRVLQIARDAPPGVYRLLIVVYQPREPFPKTAAFDARGQYAGDQIELTRLHIR